jgi:NADH:ubiquinone reductase (H+-translocating)
MSGQSPGLATTRAWRRCTGSGSPASLAHRVYHLMWVPTLNRKACVLADWTLALFFRRDTAQLTSLEHAADDFRGAFRDT